MQFSGMGGKDPPETRRSATAAARPAFIQEATTPRWRFHSGSEVLPHLAWTRRLPEMRQARVEKTNLYYCSQV